MAEKSGAKPRHPALRPRVSARTCARVSTPDASNTQDNTTVTPSLALDQIAPPSPVIDLVQDAPPSPAIALPGQVTPTLSAAELHPGHTSF